MTSKLLAAALAALLPAPVFADESAVTGENFAEAWIDFDAEDLGCAAAINRIAPQIDAEILQGILGICAKQELRHVVLERLPEFSLYQPYLTAFGLLGEDNQEAVRAALDGEHLDLSQAETELLQNLRVSPQHHEAIMSFVNTTHEAASRTSRSVNLALQKLATGEFGDTWENILLAHGGDRVLTLPMFMGLELATADLDAATADLEEAKARHEAINRAIESGEEALELLE